MSRTSYNSIQIKRLKYPRGMSGKLLLEDLHGGLSKSWKIFFEKSPDSTIFHQVEYIRYASTENKFGDLLLVEYKEVPCFALPLHWGGRWELTTGYSGIVFPESDTEKELHHHLIRFVDWIKLNTTVNLQIIQSAQSKNVVMASRRNLISSYLHAALSPYGQGTYSRIVNIGEFNDYALLQNKFDNPVFKNFDGKLRNQIRTAIKKGVCVESVDLSDLSKRDNFVEIYSQLHVETFARTNQKPHDKLHFNCLIQGLVSEEGTCIGTLSIFDKKPIAAVITTMYRDDCLYWSGGSSLTGQQLSGNAVALFSAMEYCALLGGKRFETGRFNRRADGSKESNIEHFKSQFGGDYILVENFRTKSSLLFITRLFIARSIQLLLAKLRFLF